MTKSVHLICFILLLNACVSYTPDYDLNTSEEMPKEAAVSYLQKHPVPASRRIACDFQLNTLSAIHRQTQLSQPLAYSLFSVEVVKMVGNPEEVFIWQNNLSSFVKYDYRGNSCSLAVTNEKEIRNAITALKSLGVKVP